MSSKKSRRSFRDNNWIIVGNGYIASRHIDAIESIGGVVAGVVDIDISKKPMNYTFSKSYQDMIDHNDSEWVVICTPNDTHVEIAQKAQFQGKKVLIEKPIGLSTKSLSTLKNGAFGVLQLRYHPVLSSISVDDGKNTVSMTIKVARGQDYWEGWKGKEERSGGILFNIGVHYFDLLINLFGNDYDILSAKTSKDSAYGAIQFYKEGRHHATAKYSLGITSDESSRSIIVNGKDYELSKKDNLSHEDLHKTLYKELVSGRGIPIPECAKSIKMIERIKNA